MPTLTPGQAAAALGELPIAQTITTALDAGAARLAAAIGEELATAPGGPHQFPWRQTGALQASIAHNTTGLTAEIGSNDPAAAAQELGTAHLQPRPFFLPAAAAMAEPIAQDIAHALAALLSARLD